MYIHSPATFPTPPGVTHLFSLGFNTLTPGFHLSSLILVSARVHGRLLTQHITAVQSYPEVSYLPHSSQVLTMTCDPASLNLSPPYTPLPHPHPRFLLLQLGLSCHSLSRLSLLSPRPFALAVPSFWNVLSSDPFRSLYNVPLSERPSLISCFVAP